MRSSLTSVSRFLSIISVVLALLAIGCDDDAATCGPGDAPEDGLLVEGTDVSLRFEALEYGQNNDCPIDDTPEGVISLTIAGKQVGSALGLITFCVPRPDVFNAGEDLIADDPTLETPEVRVVDVIGEADGCTFMFDDDAAVLGRANSEGLCEDGASTAGFAFVIDGAISLTRTCGPTVDTVNVALSGRVAALPQP